MSFAALSAALLLIGAQSLPGYQLDIVIVKDGVETIVAQTQVTEDQPTRMNISQGDKTYNLDAQIYTIQGDGNAAVMQLDANISMNDETVAIPAATFMRGQPLHFRSGTSDKDMIRLDLTPLPITPE